MEAIVEFDYRAQHDDELTIAVGDIISNIRKDDGGWWEGELAGRRGFFPDNFVREMKKEVKKEVSSGAKKAELPNGAPSPGTEPSMRAIKKAGDAIRRRRCKVAFSYAPQNEDELELKIGDVIDILAEVEEGWWEGTLHGKVGMFPSNFTKLLLDEAEDPPTPQEDSRSGRTSMKDSTGSESDGGDSGSVRSDTGSVASGSGGIQPKKVRGVGFGDIFKDQAIKLRPRSMDADSELEKQAVKKAPPPAGGQDAVKSDPDAKAKAAAKELCKVLFPYEAQNEDELSIKEGDIVAIITKECADTGWWLGELNGKQGVFPDNFVKLFIPEVEKERPKKPPPPAAPSAKQNAETRKPDSKPDGKTDMKKVPPERPECLPQRGEDRGDEVKVVEIPKPALPGIPPKKPLPPKATNSLGRPPPASSGPRRPERPERPAVPSTQSDSSKSEGGTPASDRGSSDRSTDIDVEDLDSIVSSTERLNHPTASRPRMIDRRPRSQIFTSSSLSSPDLQDSLVLDDEKPEKEKEGQDSPSSKALDATRKVPKTAPVLPTSDKSALPPKPVIPSLSSGTTPPASASGGSSDPPSLEELKAQLRDLQAAVEMMKLQHKKEIKQLTGELDEERKSRLTLQMEVESIKKALCK
ncbi:SH3 domain-containing kinase-binding protein 1 isoform X4 [Brienomyrus brachyistius]|uniref:SH3 domain-containing kinase-binding protein 1 isoform X4 n=1 Tax=Brienomyrus brachyistius TaxID=42636 RepID=UPI0020B3A548|nr:SH3 domain-containing kinase-binding protein 1 isoform X4 [Brienomyrus brachyistius]